MLVGYILDVDCPKCHLPIDGSVWQCDGCGFELRNDFDKLRSELHAQVRTTRTALWLAVIADLGIAAGLVVLAMHGWIYVSLPLVLGAVGVTARNVHRLSVVREDLRQLDRRHVPLPKAIASRSDAT